ncbi:MAG: hypothetical protein RDU76_07330 [Candidatus Edwardsbacteria bacterium]|nr:hypothetical protein [Candidatus Edwardsbacteria bacterium]
MRILAFTIGPHYLGLPAEYINSVGRREAVPAGAERAWAQEYDLPQAFGVKDGPADRVINCAWNGRDIRLLVNRIVGLVDLDDQTLGVWPSILKEIPQFYALGMTDSQMYLLLDLSQIESLGAAG